MSSLVFDQATVKYGSGKAALTAVDRVTLVVPHATTVGLVGESGSGKSTLAAAAVGLTKLTTGVISLDDVDVSRSSRSSRLARHQIQLVFQDPYSSLDPRRTVGDTIAEAMGATTHRWTKAQKSDRIEELLVRVEIDPRRQGALPSAFSGGQRQRIALARALAAEPTVLIADEITSALDVSVQSTVLNLLRDIQRELGLTILFISHNLAVVRWVADSICVMKGGRIVERGPTDEVIDNPSEPYTKELLSCIPVLGERLFQT